MSGIYERDNLMQIIYLVQARNKKGWTDWYLVRAESAQAARMAIFDEAQRAWGEHFFYKSMRITRALKPNQEMNFVLQTHDLEVS